MMSSVSVTCDGDWANPEVQVSGSVTQLHAFAELLNSTDELRLMDVPILEDEFYPVSIPAIEIGLSALKSDRIVVTINSQLFKLQGTSNALQKLGGSLLNYFNDSSSVGDHFQLDYYEGNQVLEETNCHLIFICDR